MNIVFDLCGVVFEWTPQVILAGVDVEPALRTQVIAGLFDHADWLELDRGILPRPEAIRRSAAHTRLPAATVAALIPYIPRALVIMPGMVELLDRLKAGEHTLFYLSNMNLDCIEHIERTCPFWKVFEGGIVSCRVHHLKPEPAIYAALLDTYGLDGLETLFIDDREINLDAARPFGIQTIHFKSPEQCKAQLETLTSVISITGGARS